MLQLILSIIAAFVGCVVAAVMNIDGSSSVVAVVAFIATVGMVVVTALVGVTAIVEWIVLRHSRRGEYIADGCDSPRVQLLDTLRCIKYSSGFGVVYGTCITGYNVCIHDIYMYTSVCMCGVGVCMVLLHGSVYCIHVMRGGVGIHIPTSNMGRLSCTWCMETGPP